MPLRTNERGRTSRAAALEALDRRLLMSVNVAINAAQQFQTMTGFGTAMYSATSSAPYDAPAGSAEYQDFVNDYVNDLGNTMVRINFQSDVLPTQPTVPLGTNLAANIAALNLQSPNASFYGNLAEALTKADGGKLQVIATIWSPPAWMKANDSLVSTDLNPTTYIDPLNHLLFEDNNPADIAVQTNMLDPTNLTQFARYCAAYVAGMQQTYGIHITALSIQNELLFNEPYDSCTYYQDSSLDPTDVQYRRYAQAVQAVGEELLQDGLTTTIMGPESVGPDSGVIDAAGDPPMTERQEGYIEAVEDDTTVDQYGNTAADYLGAFAIHGWGGDGVDAASARDNWAPYEATLAAQPIPRPSWQTEANSGSTSWLGTTSTGAANPLGGALGFGLEMHDTFTAGDVSAFLYWQAADGHTAPYGNDLMDSTAATAANPERTDVPQWNYVVFKHWSRYVVPGSVRVGTDYTTDAGVAVAEDPTTVNTDAYLDTAGQTLTVELTNEAATPETVNISLDGTAVANFNQAWLTDASNTWTSLGTVSVVNGVATLTLPAYSIVTLQGSTAVGSVAGALFADTNADGKRNLGEGGVAGQTVYADLNGNGVPDPGEPSTITAADGSYSLPVVPAGTYDVRVVAPGWRQTSPSGGAGQSVTVATGGAVTGVDFGLTQAPPVAAPGGPYTVPEGGTVTLNGSGSFEAAGTVSLYQWDTNYNGTTFNPVATGATPTFSAAGLDGPSTRTIALQVTGADGLVSPVVTTTVAITDVPPRATFSGSTVTLGQAGTVTFTNATDPSPADVAAGFTYSYDLNDDGTFDLSNVTAATATVPAADLTTVGPHTVRGEIFDKDGGYTAYTTTVQVNAAGTITGSVLADPTGTGVTTGGLAGVTVYIDANLDGTLDGSDVSVMTSGAGGYTFTGLAPGTYRVREVAPAGDTLETPTAGYYDVTVAAGQSAAGGTFVDRVPSVSPTATKLTGTVIGTTGSFDSDGNTAANAFDGNLSTYFDAPTAGTASVPVWVGLDLGATYSVTQVRFASRAGWASRMNGGAFQASNSPTFASGVVTLYTLAANANPPSGVLTTQAVTTAGVGYRYVRYLAPSGGFGNVAEVQFFGTPAAGPTPTPTPTPSPTPTQWSGTVIGTAGSFANDGNTAAKAFDGNLTTFFDAPTASGAYAGLDLGVPRAITAVSFAPRGGWATRMVGGAFQASNTADFSSGVVTLYTVAAAPASGVLTTAAVTASGTYRYVRYLGPANGFCNVAEVEFLGPASTTPTELTGTPFGTAGSYLNEGNTIAKALDGNLSTFFDGPTASGNIVGIDLGSARTVTELAFAPRAGWASRMVGGVFQASNTADFSAGVVTAFTVTSAPAAGQLTTVGLALPTSYRYWRYLSPAGSFGDIAEFQLFGS